MHAFLNQMKPVEEFTLAVRIHFFAQVEAKGRGQTRFVERFKR